MQLTLLNDSGKFDELDGTIRHVFAETAHKLNALFNLSQLDVTFSPFAEGDAPDSGIGGWAINMYRIELQLDLERPDIKEVIITELPAVLAHEVHHIVQKKNKVEPETLAETLIFEGLACYFEQRFNGGTLPSLFKASHHHDWQSLLAEMTPHLSSKQFNYLDFFYCRDNRPFPKYAGYWVGFNLVANYLAKNGLNEIEVMGLPAEAYFN
ncbi:DUF2268 domain-containing putative Zn-dependent protease [Aeromonas veronii]|uniref:DUF2268 domain-containing putative Zn-dependent protease n=1 Tax=Aeromonas veronii TaxID=654 RepID=UPI002B49DFAE|nr:DUF2268 domain-containing putative Zn-dependent protease [Aeromonas veronii]